MDLRQTFQGNLAASNSTLVGYNEKLESPLVELYQGWQNSRQQHELIQVGYILAFRSFPVESPVAIQEDGPTVEVRFQSGGRQVD